jgi:hypothetical protein
MNHRKAWIGIGVGGGLAAAGLGGLIYMQNQNITKAREEVAEHHHVSLPKAALESKVNPQQDNRHSFAGLAYYLAFHRNIFEQSLA